MLFLPFFLFVLAFFAFCVVGVLVAAFVSLHWLLPYAQSHGKVYLEHQLQSFLKQFYSYAQFWGFLPTKNNMSQDKSLQKSSQARSDMVMQKPGPDEKQMENKEGEGIPPSPALVAATSEEISHMTSEQQDEQVIALLHLLEQQKVHKKYGIVTHDTWRGSLYMGSGALAGALFGGPLGAIAGIIGGGAVGWWRSSHYQEVEKLVQALPPAKRQTLLLEVSKIIGKKATVMGIEEIKPFQSRIWRIVRKFATKDIQKYLDGLDEFVADTKQKCSTTKYDKPEGVEAMKRELSNKNVMNVAAAPIKQKQ